MASSHHFTFSRQISARLAPLVSSSAVFLLPRWPETPASAVSSMSEMSDQIVHHICGHSGCAHSDVRSLSTTIVEGPTERRKSRLASHETCDGLTVTYSGESLDRTDTVPKRSRKHRSRAGLREASRRDKAVRSLSLDHSLCPEM